MIIIIALLTLKVVICMLNVKGITLMIMPHKITMLSGIASNNSDIATSSCNGNTETK